MYRTIMVPLDGSLLAERALPYARALAKAGGGEIVVVRVVAPPRFQSEYHRLGRTNAMAEAEAYLATIVARLEPDVTIRPETYFDDPAMAIVNEVHRRPVDVLVMSTHGRAGLGGLIYGSVAEQVFRHIAIPALIVPPNCSQEWPVGRRPRILVPLDGSDLVAEVIPSARELAEVLDAELRLLRIVAPRGVDVGEAESYLETVAVNLRAEGQTVSTEVVESTNPASVIANAAEENDADVIAMSTHGRSGVARLVMGSVAAGTIQKATVPILLARPVAMRHPLAQPQMIKSAPGVRVSG